MPSAGFKSNPSLILLYQIAETTGQSVQQVKKTTTMEELAEWSFFLNSPFSSKGRELFLNAWLVQVIRSIMASRTNKPKFKDSMFPIDRYVKDFFAERGIKVRAEGTTEPDVKLTTTGEVSHMAHAWRQRYEQYEKDFRAGKVTNSYGYYYGEKMATTETV